MRILKPNSLLGALLVFAVLLFQPLSADAQCMVSSVSTGSGITGGMNYNYVIKYLSSSNTCSLTMQMNVISCAPSAPGYGDALTASAYTVTISPSCGWSCGCGPVVIDSTDGLPVELMGFSIEAEVEKG